MVISPQAFDRIARDGRADAKGGGVGDEADAAVAGGGAEDLKVDGDIVENGCRGGAGEEKG